MSFSRRINRISVKAVGRPHKDRPTEIILTHRNGSDDVASMVELDNLEEVRDLHYALGRLIQSVEGPSDG